MLKILLTRIHVVKGRYIVYLDSDNKYSFLNKRKAVDFLRLISERLTETMVFINEEYAACNNIYRQYFFLIEEFKLRYQVENCLDYLKTKIALLLFRSESENRNTLVMIGIENMLFELKTVYNLLSDLAISRSDTQIRHTIGTKLRILDLFLADLRKFEIEIEVQRSEITVIEKNNLKCKIS